MTTHPDSGATAEEPGLQAGLQTWTELQAGLWRWVDSCNVYAVSVGGGVVVINVGSGAWLDDLDAFPEDVVAALCTHTGQGHAEGAARVAAEGLDLYVPEGEVADFAEPQRHVGGDERYEAVEAFRFAFARVDQVRGCIPLSDYDQLELAGLTFSVVPAPGARLQQVALAVQLPWGKVVFAGETIHSPGRVPRLAPLQQSYLDLGGVPMVYWSAQKLMALEAELLLPSFGDPIPNPGPALASLRTNLRRLCERRFGGPIDQVTSWTQFLDILDGPELEQVGPRVFRSLQSFGVSVFVISEAGRVLAFDYGYALAAMNWFVPGTPSNRRYLLHSLDGLADLVGHREIDVCMPTHYHDDHVGGIPLLQRTQATEAWVCQTFADVVEHPERFNLAAQAPRPLRIDRRFSPGDELEWENLRIEVAPPFSGHTAFCTAFGFEVEDRRYAVVGDQYLSRLLWLPELGHSWDDDEFDDVYSPLNRYSLDGYRRSAKWVAEFGPDVLLNGHQQPIPFTTQVRRRMDEFTERFEELHTLCAPLGEEDVHFGADGVGGELNPYRVCCSEGASVRFEAKVRNPLPREAELVVWIRGPEDWHGAPSRAVVPAHGQATVPLEITAPRRSIDRQPVALECSADGQPFGQIGEALITVGP